MKTKTLATGVIASAVALMVSGVSYAVEPRSVEALGETAMAISHGEDGHADVLIQHAEKALKKAEASVKAHAESHQHMEKAVKHLNAAIEQGKQGHAEEATNHALEALTHIRRSQAW
jgi:Small metal-binding protein